MPLLLNASKDTPTDLCLLWILLWMVMETNGNGRSFRKTTFWKNMTKVPEFLRAGAPSSWLVGQESLESTLGSWAPLYLLRHIRLTEPFLISSKDLTVQSRWVHRYELVYTEELLCPNELFGMSVARWGDTMHLTELAIGKYSPSTHHAVFYTHTHTHTHTHTLAWSLCSISFHGHTRNKDHCKFFFGEGKNCERRPHFHPALMLLSTPP